MGDFRQLIRFEVANSAVAFRRAAYGKDSRPEMLRDMLGLANAGVRGPRYIFLGVDDTVGGAREIVGVTEAEAAQVQKLCQKLSVEFVDPPLAVRVEEQIVDGARVVVLILPDCSDPPYLLKRSASNTMRTGNGWVRQGTSYRRLTREDLQRIFEQKLLSQSVGAEIRVGFAGRILESVLHLPILRLEELPSEAASVKLKKMIEARQAAEAFSGNDGTRLQRLVHARVFGVDETYRSHSEATLLERLDRTSEDYEAADRHYEFETRAHKVNLVVENVAGAPFERGTLILDFPCMDGVEIAEKIWPSPDGAARVPDGYPTVDVGPRTTRIQSSIGSIPIGGKAMAFRQPLRLCLREAGIGNTIPISYSVHGRGLRATVSGTLRINILDDQPQAKPPRKRA